MAKSTGSAPKAAETGGTADTAALAASLAPRDGLEAMLAEQMAAVHAAALRALHRAAECKDHPQIEALYLRQAARLMHLFARQAEALERCRDAAEARADEAERKARVREHEQREEAERARREEAHLARWGLSTAPRRRPAKRTGKANGRGNGTAGAADEPPAGLSIPDPMPG